MLYGVGVSLIAFPLIFLCAIQHRTADNFGPDSHSNHDFDVAMQHFNHVISSKPYRYEEWFYRGLCKLQLDDYVGAESDFNKAVELNSYVLELFSAWFESRIRLKKYAEVLDDYEQALRLFPDRDGYWFNRAYCHFFEGLSAGSR